MPNKTTLLLKETFGRSIHVREVLSVPARIKTHSIHGPLRVEVPYDKEGRKSTTYSMDPSVTRIRLGDWDKKGVVNIVADYLSKISNAPTESKISNAPTE